ncbi:Protein CBR-SRE-20 [Caenorhabditis briggsae]|uniref:Protein CBR-SRE-20 n=1 Tax=Caenorhabditis briggsae TaxID=6238 RepID=A8X720_CAEBR|nr:Protein CBR-SRE-20 [Caenorhabditis briggsae]CAP28431.2 Protein CBR-SRE-20 [Caenorhabditis briggsae]
MSMLENIAYIVIVTVASLFTVLCLLVVARSNVFHTNLQASIWWTASFYFELTVSKMLTIVYQSNYLTDRDEPSGGMVMLMWIAATHYHFIFAVMSAPIVVVAERSLATKFVFDYEKERRRYILISLFLFQIGFSTSFTLLTIFNIVRYVSAAVIAGLIAITSLLIFLHINRVNKRTLRFVETQNRDIKFDLSVRYQLRENVKTFKMLTTLLLLLTFMIVFLAFLKTIPMIMDIQEDTKYIFKMSTDMILHAGPIYVTPTMIWAVDDYKIVFYRILGLDKKKVAPLILSSEKKEEDVYFEQFVQSLKQKMFKFLLGFNVTGFYEREMTAEYTLEYMILYTITMILALFVTSFGIRISLSISFS